MSIAYRDITKNDRQNVKEQAIKLIDECLEKNAGFVLYTSSEINGDLMSASNKQLFVIIGTLLMNAMQLENEKPGHGFSKDELLKILDRAEKFANEEKIEEEKKVMNSVDEYLVKVLEDLKNKIENLEKNEEEK